MDRKVEFEIIHAPLGRPFDGLGHFHAKWHRDTVELPADRWPDWIMLQTAGPRPVLRRDAARLEPARRLVGRRRREVLRRRREIPLHDRHRLGRLFRLRLGQSAISSRSLSRPDHDPDATRGTSPCCAGTSSTTCRSRSRSRAASRSTYKNDRGTLYAVHRLLVPVARRRDPYGPVPVAQRDGYYMMPDMVVAGIKVLNDAAAATPSSRRWGISATRNGRTTSNSGGPAQARRQAGARRLPVAKAARYEVNVDLTKARDYGIVQFWLDGEKAGEADRSLQPGGRSQRPDRAGRLTTWPRASTSLTVEIVGANPQGREVLHVRHRPLELN